MTVSRFATTLMGHVNGAGQSNMIDGGSVGGNAIVDPPLTDQPQATPFVQTRLYSQQAEYANPPTWFINRWQPAQSIRWAGGFDRIGMISPISEYLNCANPGGYVTSRFAINATSLINDWNPDGTFPTGSPPNLWQQWITFLYARVAECGIPIEDLVIVWCQGEYDANDTAGPVYGANLTNFVNRTRAALGYAVPFVITLLPAECTFGTAIGRAGVRAGQQSVCATLPDCYLADFDSITIASGLYDGAHYTADGYQACAPFVVEQVAIARGQTVPPQADFTVVRNLTTPLECTFTDTSMVFGSWTVTSLLWDFGDGNTSAAANPTHTYADATPRTARLTVFGADGRSTTISYPIYPGGYAGVYRDPRSGKYAPQASAQWRALLDAIPSLAAKPDPVAAWGMQDPSAPLGDMMGTATLAGVNVQNMIYRVPVPAWNRQAMWQLTQTYQYGATAGFVSTSSVLPSLATTPGFAFGIELFPTSPPTVGRNNVLLGANATRAQLLTLATSGFLQANSGSNVANGAINMCDGLDHPVGVSWSLGPATMRGLSEKEVLTPVALAGTAGQQIAFAAVSGGALALAGGGYLLGVVWAVAWTLSEIRDLWTAMGYTVLW